MNYTEIAKNVILEEAKSLEDLARNLPSQLSDCINHIIDTKGRAIVSGMGKSGHIAQKIAASLASTGTPAFYIHPGEASHGDLGMITEDDTVILLSNSGETKELFDTINYCRRFDIKIAGMTMKPESTLGKNSDYLLLIPDVKEISELNAPTNSASMMLSLGHALVVCLYRAKGFTKEQFRNFHPGGKIGTNLMKVSDLMYSGNKLPIVHSEMTFNEAILIITEKSLGCAVVTDNNDKVKGVITDGDLRRHINDSNLHVLTAEQLMTPAPVTINPEKLATEALFIMNNKAITAIPVEQDNKLVGMIHIHDILRAGIS